MISFSVPKLCVVWEVTDAIHSHDVSFVGFTHVLAVSLCESFALLSSRPFSAANFRTSSINFFAVIFRQHLDTFYFLFIGNLLRYGIISIYVLANSSDHFGNQSIMESVYVQDSFLQSPSETRECCKFSL
jgi:hypothetical protein